MSFSMTDLTKVLKRRYTRAPIADATLQKFPLFAEIKKDNDFSGESMSVPIRYAHQQGRAHTFASASLNNGNPKYETWKIDVVPDYVDAQVPREAALRTRDQGAFISLFAEAIEDGIAVLDENCAGELYRTSGGARGQSSAAAVVGSTALLLADASQEAMFEPGMVIAAGPNADGSSLRAGSVAITAVDRDAGVLYAAANWSSGISGLTAGDYLFQDGDVAKAITGLQSWLVTARPTPGESFFGVDRSADNRLYGSYYNGTGIAIEEAIKRGCALAYRRGGSPNRVYLHPDDFQDLEISLLNSNLLRRNSIDSGDGVWGFEGIEIGYGGDRKAVCLADPKAIKNTAFALTLEDWHLTYMGPKAGATVIADDGQLIRVSTADSFDIRCGHWCQMFTTRPAASCRIALR